MLLYSLKINFFWNFAKNRVLHLLQNTISFLNKTSITFGNHFTRFLMTILAHSFPKNTKSLDPPRTKRRAPKSTFNTNTYSSPKTPKLTKNLKTRHLRPTTNKLFTRKRWRQRVSSSLCHPASTSLRIQFTSDLDGFAARRRSKKIRRTSD
jgi:hypothetical protein